ncbi:hypothetical protein JOF28_001390 [Leucobacter exalbidus]|uniref:Uncharacterized protein n=1 Tax=Leucobacter exalbidus TaxID=662960 RepID=A0A940PSU8_9MICO|nr:hypothetical protein [Leucobacter exalbidus]MBP1326158.1 hypothetical protein [Leucobacter exalbidus]
MNDISAEGRPAAGSLWVTFRHDGALLLELLADRYTVIGAAESHVDDAERTAIILRSWALGQGLDERAQEIRDTGAPRDEFAALRHEYSQGLALSFVGALRRDRSALGNTSQDDELFREMFGSEVPADVRRLESFSARLASEMQRFFRRARGKAQQRLAGGAYLLVLNDYLDQLRAMRSGPAGYRTIEHTLVAIIHEERYLRIAEDDRARELIIKIEHELSDLYGRAMDLERGGQLR